MEWKLRVPKVLHVYWGGDPLSYMRYLTVATFVRYNPDWKVILWTPSVPSVRRTWTSWELNYEILCDDFYPRLLELPIDVRKVDFTDFGFDNSISEVHKSDYLRLHLLSTMGGVWADMDIIFFKPMTALAVNDDSNKDKDTFVCIGRYGHSAGLLMSAPGSKYYGKLCALAKEKFDPKAYQGIGATMFNDYFPNIKKVMALSPAVNLDMDVVYAHDATRVSDLISNRPSRFTHNSIGVHWYAGHPQWGKFLEDTNGGQTNLPDSIISKVLKAV